MSAAEQIQTRRISNGISMARIITMFWIFSTNYFPWIFANYYGIDFKEAASDTRIFSGLQAASPWAADRVLFWFSSAEWPPVTIFAFFSGFSLWFSILNSGMFKPGEYALNRFNSIYIPFFIAALAAFFAGAVLRGVEVESMDLGALLMGATLFVPSAARYNGAIWFMTMILLMYLFFPIIPVIYNRFRVWGVLALTLAAYAYFAFFGASYFMINWGPLYPIMPFWLFLCLGVLACHLIFIHKDSVVRIRRMNLGILRILSFPAIFAGMYLIYRFLYVEPSANSEGAWFAANALWAGIAGAFFFFAAGYLLPDRFHRPLRWLSDGTFTVFLYHFTILPFVARFMGPPVTTHISIALISAYSVALVGSSIFQQLLNRTVVRLARNLSSRAYKITVHDASPVVGASPATTYKARTKPGTLSRPRW